MARIKVQAKAAAALGVTAQTLTNWKRQDWWVADWCTSEGYDVAAIQRRPGGGEQADRNKMDSDSRKMNQAERAMRLQLMKMRVDERAGQLVNLQEVIEGMRMAQSGFAGIIMDIPVRAARLMPEGTLRSEVMAEIDLTCRNALRGLADDMRIHFERLGAKLTKKK